MSDPCQKETEFQNIWAKLNKVANGKIIWQAAFWVLTVGLVILGTNMVANDRIRASEDIRLGGNITKNTATMLSNTALIKTLDSRLNRIELKLDRILEWDHA